MTWNEGMNDSFDTHLSRRLFQSCMVLIQSPPLYATYYCFFSSPNTAHFYFLLFSSTFVRLYLIEYLLLLNMLNIHSRYFMEVSYCCSNAWRRSEFLFYNYHICVILSRKIYDFSLDWFKMIYTIGILNFAFEFDNFNMNFRHEWLLQCVDFVV